MSTPTDGVDRDQPWQPPGQSSPGSGYGQPSSPSYGKYGQGQALPTAPSPPGLQPPGQQGWGQPGPGQLGWGQPGYGPLPQPQWTGGPTVLQPTSSGLRTAMIACSVLFGVTICLLGALAPNQHQVLLDAVHSIENASTSPNPPIITPAPGSTAYRVVSTLAILVEVAVWVTGCLWLTRARQNAVVLRPHGQRRSETWVWLGWIVPIVNLWFPMQILGDTLTATASAIGERRMRTGPWWAVWLLMNVLELSQGVSTMFPPNTALHAGLSVAAATVTITGLVLWIRMVRWISATQDALAARQPMTTLQG